MLSAFTSINFLHPMFSLKDEVLLHYSVLRSLFVDVGGGLVEALVWDRDNDEGKLTSWLF